MSITECATHEHVCIIPVSCKEADTKQRVQSSRLLNYCLKSTITVEQQSMKFQEFFKLNNNLLSNFMHT